METHLRALEAAEASRLDYKRSISLAELSYVMGVHLGDFEQARWYARTAHAVLDRVGGSKLRRAHLLSDEAIVETLAGNLDYALQLGERALRFREEAGLENDLTQAVLRTNFGGALFSAGRYEEALEQYQAAYAIREEQVGQWHPTMAVSLENMGNCLQALGRHEEALERHKAALAMTRAANMTGAKLAGQLNNVAVALFGTKRYDEARQYYLEAIAAYRGSSEKHPALGVALSNLGELEMRSGRIDEARRRYEAALEQFDATVSPDHPWRVLAQTGLGAVLVDEGEAQRGLVLLERAAEILAATPLDPLVDEEAKLHLGRAIWEVKPDERARAHGLVEEAEGELGKLGERGAASLRTAREWLERHPL
jgi:tetratricopeptide (TPR) repeat protein